MTPEEFFASLGVADAVLRVVGWIAGGIAAAMALYFAVLGIRMGLSWFFAIVGGRGAVVVGSDEWYMDGFRAWRDYEDDGTIHDHAHAYGSAVFNESLGQGATLEQALADSDAAEAAVRRHFG